jgi:hypothetical protein
MAAWVFFLVAQATLSLPLFQSGSEVRLVSPDLLTVYSSGRVVDDRLVIDLPVAAGSEVRLLVFPPDASDSEVAQALSGAAAIMGRVAEDRADLVVRFPGRDTPVSLREWLRDERGITLVLVTRRSM